MLRFRFAPPAAALALLLAAPAMARGGWGDPGWDSGPWGGATRSSPSRRADDAPEGRVTVSRFVAAGDAARTLGQGTIAATGAPTGSGADSRELAVYEAATLDQLAQLGYRTDVAPASAGQIVELHVSHDEVAPREAHKPVSGEATVGMSNRGSMMGLAVAVDLSKPKGALVATRLEARIRDSASKAVLWEGRADTVTRAGNEKWSESAIAAHLAAALFDHFPGGATMAERDR